jgi:hypothetical protein
LFVEFGGHFGVFLLKIEFFCRSQQKGARTQFRPPHFVGNGAFWDSRWGGFFGNFRCFRLVFVRAVHRSRSDQKSMHFSSILERFGIVFIGFCLVGQAL